MMTGVRSDSGATDPFCSAASCGARTITTGSGVGTLSAAMAGVSERSAGGGAGTWVGFCASGGVLSVVRIGSAVT